MQDRLLLKQFSTYGSQAAFAEIVKRYMRLVYSTCLREVGDRQMAEDVTQGVFLILAQKTPALGRHTSLAGWLFWTARLASRDALRKERRRQRRECAAAQAEEEAHWPKASPHQQETLLNEALAALKPGEREAVLLRFFDEASFLEVGTTLGLSEDTAQKRVSRALEKMRAYFARNQEVLSTTALMGVLAAEAARGAAPGCAKPLLQIVPGLKISLLDSSLFGTQAYHISQGVLRMMKVKTALTTMGIGALAVASVSLLMAGAVRGANGIIGTWVTTQVEYGNISPGATKPEQIIVTSTYRFKSDDTLTVTEVGTKPEVHKTETAITTGRYSVTGKSLTLFLMHTTDGSKLLPHVTAIMTFSNGGKVVTLKGPGQRITVLTRQ